MNVVEPVLILSRLSVPRNVSDVVGNDLMIGILNGGMHLQVVGFEIAGYLGLYGYRCIGLAHFGRGDVDGMTGEVQVGRSDGKPHIPYQSTSRIPS